MKFSIHDQESVSAEGQEIIKGVKNKYGFVPNLLATMVESPALAKAYIALSDIFDASSFTAEEKQIVLMTVSFVNGCSYCMAAHSVIAGMQEVPEEIIQALRDHKPLADRKLEALRRLTENLVENGGYPDDDKIKDFVDAGYAQQQVLEIVLGIGLKTLSNYTNHIAKTPLDEAFRHAEWHKPKSEAA
ncbi:MAG: carboxymuconolactone decarboxylase family protein [Micavibrio sp.]|nr:MAG: carboxymuconolactone decarboxylase family protein [Micavibrio sp.]